MIEKDGARIDYEAATAAILAADPVADADHVCAIAESWLDRLASDWPSDHGVPRLILIAGMHAARYDLIARLADYLADALWTLPIERNLVSLLGNVRFLNGMQIGIELLGRPPADDARLFWRKAISSCSEVRLLRAFDDLLRPSRALSLDTVTRIVAVAALARQQRWSAAYRHAQRVLVLGMPIAHSQHLNTVWEAFELPAAAQASLLDHVGRQASASESDQSWEEVLSCFDATPDITTAQIVWEKAKLQSRLAALIGGAPISDDDRAVLTSRIAAPGPRSLGPAWVYMTWREGADSLLGLVSGYLDANSRVVISVGGDGRPPDLSRASALLLADRTHMVAQPVVTWGGPKLFFYNLLPVLDAFRARASEDGWFAVVCDRSFPLHGLARFVERIDDTNIMSRVGLLHAPHSWHQEWEEETVANLPALLDTAIEELFQSGKADGLIALAGPTSEYFPQTDFRLDQCHINFAKAATAITGNTRLSAQQYLVAPFNVDLRWLSLGRLTEFVDVGTEEQTTYVRRLHPWVAQAIHQVLRPQQLRIGDPFFVANRNYADRLFDDPERFALFWAMNAGLGPEMHFFDTFAWTHGLLDSFYHLFTRQPVEDVGVNSLEPVLEDADASGHQFVRKVVCDPHDALLNMLARRLIDDSGWRDFNWTVAGPRTNPARNDPVPSLDQTLVERLVGLPLVVRDLLNRQRQSTILHASGSLGEASRSIGSWHYKKSAITVDFNDPLLGRKVYQSIGCDAERLTLVPDEIVDVHNQWSAFLDFSLDDLPDHDLELVRLQPGELLLERSTLWIGGPKEDSNIVAAFADLERSTPTPTFRQEGCGIEMRTCGSRVLVLAKVGKCPALLRVRGAGKADGRSIVMMSSATEDDLASWRTGLRTNPVYRLHARDLPGRWVLETLESDRVVELRPGGIIHDDKGRRIGRWLARDDGVQLLGLDQMRVALATQYRIHDGSWRLTGWAKRNMQDMQTFALRQLPPSNG